MAEEKHTPLMQQYFDIKAKYPGTVLLFQVGDFYELFFDDAKVASSFLAIALTKRGKTKGQDVPLCGIPVHALNHYLVKLIKGGFKVAICDQVTKPQSGTVVQRKVTQVFTPGTLTDSSMLDEKSASYIFSFYPGHESWGLIFTELLTAQIFATTVPARSYKMVETELSRFFPDEIVLPDIKKVQAYSSFFKKLGYLVSFASILDQTQAKLGDDVAGQPVCKLWLENQFDFSILDKLQKLPVLGQTLDVLYHYLAKNQEKALPQLKTIRFYDSQDYLILDYATQKNLEVVKNNQDGTRKNSIFSILDRAKTGMGSRTIKKWLLRPLVQEKTILQRQEIVSALCKNIDLMQKVEEFLANVADIERIVGRVALRRATLNDYLALKQTLFILPELKKIIEQNLDFYLANLIKEKMENFSALAQLLECSLNDDGICKWTIKKGFDLEIDQLRELAENGQQKILQLERQEVEKTGINSLKIRYNQVAGYFIEVTKPNLRLVPDYYIAQQTLVNRSRFVTVQLKDLETQLLKAQNEIEIVEEKVFERVKKEVEQRLADLRQLAQALAYFDALFGFAKTAYDFSYVQPIFDQIGDIIIKNGRHPVVEQKLNAVFIPNDTNLTKDEFLWIVTGPNMGGKSTYLRQVALICIMAQCGSFVPADNAVLPILDRIFTRIGSGDNLAEGKSTFLVEMEETATICSQATKDSLVILDEVGRGTSTFDGMAIAQAIIEYLFQNIGAKALFATHYCELTQLSEKFTGIANYHVESRKTKDRIVFLFKVAKGVCKASFGIEVAKLAGLPAHIVDRATFLLEKMEAQKIYETKLLKQQNMFEQPKVQDKEPLLKQLEKQNKILDCIKNINLDELSPKQAFDLLWAIKFKNKL